MKVLIVGYEPLRSLRGTPFSVNYHHSSGRMSFA
jgi:hypothetical protein